MDSSKHHGLRVAAVVGAGTAALVGAYVLYSRLAAAATAPSAARGARATKSPVRHKTKVQLARAAKKDYEQQKRVLDRVSRFLDSGSGVHTADELDALFDEAAGDDGQISQEEFAMVVRAPLMHHVSQLIRRGVHDAALLTGRAAAGGGSGGADADDAEDPVDEGSLELAQKIQEGIPKIQAGIPALSTSMFKALDKDNSGFLDKSEFRAALGMFECFSDPAWVRGQPTPDNLAKMRPAFELLFRTADVSGTGRLNITDTQAVLRDASDFAFQFASSVVHLVSDSISGAVLTKFVAQPFKRALRDLDTDGDGTIDKSELQLEGKVGGIVGSLRSRVAPALQAHNVDAGEAAAFAQDLLQKQALSDLVVGVADAQDYLSVGDKARVGISGGVNQATFVRACVASAQDQHKSSLALVETALGATSAPSALTAVVRKLHEVVSDRGMVSSSISLRSAQHKIYSAVHALCDVNGDGKISWAEVGAWQEIQKAVTGDPTADDRKVADAIFAIIDKDGDGEISQGEVEFLVRKLGVFGAAVTEGALEVAQVFVRAGIDLLGDGDYHDLATRALADNATLTAEQKEAIADAFRQASASLAAGGAQDPSARTGERKDQLALGGVPQTGLSVDQAWAMLMAAWPGARQAAEAEAIAERETV